MWPLVAKEVETVYYAALLPAGPGGLAPPASGVTYLVTAARQPRRGRRTGRVRDPAGGPLVLGPVSRPYGDQSFTTRAELPAAGCSTHLRAGRAPRPALGNVAGPLKAALDVLRDLRNEVRLVVDHGGLSGALRRDHLDRWYTPLNAFLSIGPPRRRIEEMTALIEAGVLDRGRPAHRMLRDGGPAGSSPPSRPTCPDRSVTATTLIEARLPEPDLRRTADALLGRLLKTGQCRPHAVGRLRDGRAGRHRAPVPSDRPQGRPHPRRFAFGVPTEGVHWVTAAGVRPGVDSVTLSDADAVARRRAAHAPRAAGVRNRQRDGQRNGIPGRNRHRSKVELASID